MEKQEMNMMDKLSKMFNLDFQEPNDNIWLQSAKTLSRIIGVLGMLLPLLLWLFLVIVNQYFKVLPSISHYYFTRSNVIFIIVVSLIAIFLLVYKKGKGGFFWSTIAAIGALLLLLFPTNAITQNCCDICDSVNIAHIENNSFRNIFHYISAAIFLGSLAIMSLFVFTRENKDKLEFKPESCTPSKVTNQNVVYRVCGVIMVFSLLAIVVGSFDTNFKPIYEANNLTFWMEVIAVEAFGFSWLVKGEAFFKSK
ncbi:hypothetical protein EYD45_06960 [Hyunsoonleella flava]|uniref:DUF998 domain-containing protein n=1 Tax=Hyunsoonleella flava TaxID=2527939 RepID=A0A4Q9FDT9_9FLAO|nr:hypothetical protein [Hyunsoonleella flava]TBN04352.1 hypothetical protein EYD45_06960 [Hyunsoonleella flava]